MHIFDRNSKKWALGTPAKVLLNKFWRPTLFLDLVQGSPLQISKLASSEGLWDILDEEMVWCVYSFFCVILYAIFLIIGVIMLCYW